MRTLSKIIGWLLLAAFVTVSVLFAAFLFWLSPGKRFDWNQKVTVEVQTPEGIKSAASVQHIEWVGGANHPLTEGGNASGKTVGEAVVVDLGTGRFVFALLQGDGKSRMGQASTIAQFALCKSGEMSPGAVCFSKLDDASAGMSAVLEPGNLPMLVTFTDVNDPKTVQLVDPANLAAAFGQGYALKSIKVEITDERVTEGEIDKLLRWIPDYFDRRLDGERYGTIDSTNPLANSLASGAFSTVKKK
ncbi:MAG: hypothetical protein ACRCU5_10785 [Rhizobiaceae bacterium]